VNFKFSIIFAKAQFLTKKAECLHFIWVNFKFSIIFAKAQFLTKKIRLKSRPYGEIFS
jgi:hypothetical protein